MAKGVVGVVILYIANRGEIALRILRTAKKMGIRTVVGCSLVDRAMPFVEEADEAIEINAQDPLQAYLDIETVIQTAQKSGATHLHPGYGFLAEHAAFAQRLADEGIQFVGPSPQSMELMGDKIKAREFLEPLGIPLLPAYQDAGVSAEELLENANQIGFPLLIKPSAGGGGKGMLKVDSKENLLSSLESSKRIARSAFGDDRLYLEKRVEPARHLEVQVLGDQDGNIAILGERECSLQRRHQKIIEESPCVFLDEGLRNELFEYSHRIAQQVGYISAGTVEWIWDGDQGLYFLEMNTRLQVEHPVTELRYGIDLVEWQLRISQGESLESLKVEPQGHAMEARLCAEDPSQDFLPSAGKIYRLRLPSEIRVDFGYYEKNEVPAAYDSLLGKFIAYEDSREKAIDLSKKALKKTVLFGPKTNRSYLIQLLSDERVRNGKLSTHLLEQIPYRFDMKSALSLLQRVQQGEVDSLEEELDWYSPWGQMAQDSLPSDELWWEDLGQWRFFHTPTADWFDERPHFHALSTTQHRGFQEEVGDMRTPMPARVSALEVSLGEMVRKGQVLMILEAMKMEHKIQAPFSGEVKEILVSQGDHVDGGKILLKLEELEDERESKNC